MIEDLIPEQRKEIARKVSGAREEKNRRREERIS
jgi:hypothetical protein